MGPLTRARQFGHDQACGDGLQVGQKGVDLMPGFRRVLGEEQTRMGLG
ncbi:MAG TPA: hypothetical protein VMV09_06330 [Candidatus Saccharimonadales bacterium]|nr:hypothetical protein [Candidatus Saccharimonadales bacterium]